jgi:hypothetical protein
MCGIERELDETRDLSKNSRPPVEAASVFSAHGGTPSPSRVGPARTRTSHDVFDIGAADANTQLMIGEVRQFTPCLDPVARR